MLIVLKPLEYLCIFISQISIVQYCDRWYSSQVHNQLSFLDHHWTEISLTLLMFVLDLALSFRWECSTNLLILISVLYNFKVIVFFSLIMSYQTTIFSFISHLQFFFLFFLQVLYSHLPDYQYFESMCPYNCKENSFALQI